MKRLSRQLAIAAAALLLLAVSLGFLSYGRALRQLATANRLLEAQDYAAAERAYMEAEDRMAHGIVPAGIYRSSYRLLVFNEARLFEATRRDTELARLLERVATQHPELANDPEYHFWAGIEEYAKAASVTEKQAVRASLQRASDSFRLVLAAGDNDWDAKYNYELTARLLAGMKKSEETPEKMNRGGMKILREDPDHPKEQQQKLAPDKQS